MFPVTVPSSASTQLYEENLHEGLKSTKLQFHRMHPTKNCTFAILETKRPKTMQANLMQNIVLSLTANSTRRK